MKKFLLLMVAGFALTLGAHCFGDAISLDLSNNAGLLATMTVNNSCNSGKNVIQAFQGSIQPSHHTVCSVNEGCEVKVAGFVMDGAKKMPVVPFTLQVPNFTNSISLSIQKDGSKYVVKQK